MGDFWTDLEFADYDLTSISLDEYSLDTATGKLYNNIENSYSDSDQSFNVTFVKYTVKETSGSTQTTSVYHELISNEAVYQQASFDDIDEFGYILSGRKKYIIEQLPGLSYYLVTLPTSALYSYKETCQD